MNRIVMAVGAAVALGVGAVGMRVARCGAAPTEASCMGQSCEDPACGPGGSSPFSGAGHKTACCASGWDIAAVGSNGAASQGFDPVSRTLLDPATAVAMRRTNGVTFHFATEENARTFDAHTSDYLYCPVFRGSRVNPEISLEKDGQTFYFCCLGCRVRYQLGDVGGGDDFLGLRLALSEDKKSISIESVVPGSAVAQAGLEAGMTILAVNDQEIDGPDRLINAVGAIPTGQQFALRVRTAVGETRTIRLSLGRA